MIFNGIVHHKKEAPIIYCYFKRHASDKMGISINFNI
jgi:hypothetical protein